MRPVEVSCWRSRGRTEVELRIHGAGADENFTIWFE